VEDAPRHDADDGLISVEGMTAKRPKAEQETEECDENFGFGLGLQLRSSLLDPAASANWDHQKADGTDKMASQPGSTTVI
jgi:hypothetical protein